jgi:hypothetical protein
MTGSTRPDVSTPPLPPRNPFVHASAISEVLS